MAGGNFSFLKVHDPQLAQLGALAERFFADDANTTLIKLRQYGEVLAELLAAKLGIWVSPAETQADLLRRLKDRGVLGREIGDLFHQLRKHGNAAAHEVAGDHATALACLKIAWKLGIWFHRSVTRKPEFQPGPFVPPKPPRDEAAELRGELERLQALLSDSMGAAERAAAQAAEEAERRLSAEERAARAEADRQEWERQAAQVDADRARLEASLAEMQAAAAATPRANIEVLVAGAKEAAKSVDLDEWETRRLIDEQLRRAGWEVDTARLTFAKGARPQAGKAMAIAEWPTANGPADYVLFHGLMPLAVVEAKRMRTNVPGAIDQSKRYAEGYQPNVGEVMPEGGPWNGCRVPFLFATNGRPYLEQLKELSGIWFRDNRRAENHRHPIGGWYTPQGLLGAFRHDPVEADRRLKEKPIEFVFPLRDYQRKAIAAVEQAVARGQRACLVAMATGTGKTKTCIGVIYRLLAAKRFRRILFLVDRNALGEQTGNAFKETVIEQQMTFDRIYAVAELEQVIPDSDTKVHIATVQAMVRRILDPEQCPTVDLYDCIVVDECHRGYLLDRDMGEDELAFADQQDYQSKYRMVLDHFDAVKVGLTATPALQTTHIFGEPVYTYSYAEAVIDGWLIDHEPPFQIRTKLGEEGVAWQAGETAEALDLRTGQVDLMHMPDDVRYEVEDFNRQVLAPDFNRVVAEQLAEHIDPALPGKTLVFAATDLHADTVVRELKTAFAARYGGIEDDAVIKITGKADKPPALIRRFKNERLPSIVVTVDLLTTGIDVPQIVNLVFLRPVGSRILYEQMIGRATRLCPDIGKTSFRIYDAVGLVDAMKDFTTMKPVVANPNIRVKDLAAELVGLFGSTPVAEPASGLAEAPEPFIAAPSVQVAAKGKWLLDQLLAKLHRKARRMSEGTRARFADRAGMTPEQFILALKEGGPQHAAERLAAHPALVDLLDKAKDGEPVYIPIADHEDAPLGIHQVYGKGYERPEDYLTAFHRYVSENINRVPALSVVATRPRELTREQLKQVRMMLEDAEFGETSLRAAWRDAKNEDIAASIIGFIRQAAIGDALMPYEERVDRALRIILGSRDWKPPQRDWLTRIAKQMKREVVVDAKTLDDAEAFKAQGGFRRIDKVFDGRLAEVLAEMNDAVWRSA